MKHKIRRAFDATRPNVLDRVLQDCDHGKTAPVVPKKTRLSDRAARLIATAASFVLLVGAATGGYFYFRDYFPGNIGSNFVAPTQTDPLPAVDYDWSEDGLIQRACDIVDPSGELRTNFPPTVELIDGEYQVTVDYQFCIYTIRFSAANGALLGIDVRDNPLASDWNLIKITESVAAWIAMLDMDPEYFGLTSQCADYTVDEAVALVDFEDERPVDPIDLYVITFTHGDLQARYEINDRTGEIFCKSLTEVPSAGEKITLAEAEAILTDLVTAERGNCFILNSAVSDDSYYFEICATDDPITGDGHLALIPLIYQVDARTGQIIYEAEGRDAWNEDVAREIAGAYAQATYGDWTFTGCTYESDGGDFGYYDILVTLHSGEAKKELCIQVWEIYTTEPAVPPADTVTAIVNAREVALEQYGWTMEDVRILKITENPGSFEIYYEVGGQGYTLCVDADGNVLYDDGVTEAVCPEMPPDSIGWKTARNICLGECGRTLDEMIGFTWEIAEGMFWMELYFADGTGVSYQVDVMDGTLVADLPQLDGMISYEQAWEIAARNACCLEELIAGTLTDTVTMLEINEGSYWFSFCNGDLRWSITVDAYTGEVLKALCCNVTDQDGRISEECAILHAVAHAGCKEAYLDGALEVEPVKCDEENRCYWVYFQWEGISWEIQIGFYSFGEVLTSNSYESTTP